MTRDLHRCQVMARFNAIVDKWWSLFVRCAEPTRPREAIKSRSLLLSAVGRLSESGYQLRVLLTSTHEDAGKMPRILTQLSTSLSGLGNTAEPLTSKQPWERIWQRNLAPYLLPPPALPGAEWVTAASSGLSMQEKSGIQAAKTSRRWSGFLS